MLLSFTLGSIVGFERQLRNHAAGFRTFALICLASTLIMIVSIYVAQTYSSTSDPARIAAQVVTGIGFLGAGVIYQNKGGIRGLTTAAGIFMIAAIGLAVGAGLFKAAVIGTCLLLFILISLERIEGRMQIDTNRKHLLIEFDHINMDIDTLEAILKSNKIHIHSISVSEDFKTHSGSVDFVIAVPTSVKLPALFEQLRKTTGALSIHLESI
jgi:putative Mg2+ transporter-C (MgtC) family protein